jgi:hypothetical protein
MPEKRGQGRRRREKKSIESGEIESQESSKTVEEGREGSREVERACDRPGTLAERSRRNVGTQRAIRYEFILVRIGVGGSNDF